MSEAINKLCVETLSQPIFGFLFSIGVIYVIFLFFKTFGLDLLRGILELLSLIFSRKEVTKDISKVIKTNSTLEKENTENVCPRCGSKLVKRNGKYGEFLGCLNFPNCKYTRNIKNIDKEKI